MAAAGGRNTWTGMQPNLVIVEDDAPLREVLARSLKAEGFAVRACATARELLDHAATNAADAFVIDIGLPDADGRDLCQALRASGVQAPVLFLTARNALTDRLGGFSAGGDDYVTKPFDIEEVVVRLHSLLRRSQGGMPAVGAQGLVLDPSQHTVSRGGQLQSLTPTEFRLLAALAARPRKALARVELIRAGWPHGAIVQDNTLDVYIARIRRKLAAIPNAPTIKTLHGVGYRLQ
jgi:two-component system, OmpR family, response regulator